MNKWIMLALMVLISAAVAFAQVPSPSTPMILLPDGSYWTGAGAVTIGSVSVEVGAPPDKNSTSIVTATNAAVSVASLANRKSVAFINQSASVMGWISLDSAVASAAVGIGIPLPPYGFFSTELDAAKVVGVAADGVASITVYQDGY